MPTLDWIGKDKVKEHHRHVPLCVLRHSYGFTAETRQSPSATGSGNMIVHGDNLTALKALLPEYEGRIDCIYIDPPYNTGNENWVYNDNVDDPALRRWLGEVVGEEGKDLSRHDKWLCMMYPRLCLLRELLSRRGAIFISIDDNELYNLKAICDEIFSPGCFVADIAWQRAYSPRNDSKGIVSEAEHLLVYGGSKGWQPFKLERTPEMDARYSNPDNDVTPWTSSSTFAPNAKTHQGMVYAVQHPITGELIYPTTNRCWCFEQEEVLRIMNSWCPYRLEDIHDEARRAEVCGIDASEVRQGVKAIVLVESTDKSRELARRVYSRGQWPRFYFTRNGEGGIRRKTYLNSTGGRVVTNLWPHSEVGHTDEAKKELKRIFEGRIPFDTPKPTRLIERILQIATTQDAIVLDSFAGSGTTAHAVLRRNSVDGGRRRFILVETMDYAETITAERVRRCITGYEKTPGLGGAFDFYELGPAMYDANGRLNKDVDEETLRRMIYFEETGHPLRRARDAARPYLLDTWNGTCYCFCYEPDRETVLTEQTVDSLKTEEAGAYVIYADACTIADDALCSRHIVFRKIPRDIKKF